MKLALYAHPFDLDALADHGGLQRLADLGFGEIALATSYHDGRWLQPWHPDGRVRFLEDGAVHFCPGDDYGLLRPLASSCVDAGSSPLERLCTAAPAAGLVVRAWTVLTHNSRLGVAHPELCIENAFGDRYPYGLCPSQPEVQRYVRGIVRDLAAHAGLGAIELEAYGWMGHKHGSHHDKASFAPQGMLDYALSLCFCDGCLLQLRAGSVGPGAATDPERVRRWARDCITAALTDADAMAPPVVACDDAAEAATLAARAARATTLAALGRQLRALVPAAMQLAVQVHPTPLFTGSQTTIAATPGLAADEYVVTAYGDGPVGIDRLLRGEDMFRIAGSSRRLSIWPKAPQFTADADLAKVGELCGQHGIATLAIYHLGLLPWRTLERVARFFTA